MSEDAPNYKTKKQTIFRTMKNADNPFVMIDRRPIENSTLSWKAKGILAYLLSRPDNWTVQIGDLVKRSTDKAFAIRGAINELIKAGHIYRREERDEKGRFIRYLLEVYEIPFTGNPLVDFPQADNPQAGNLPLNNIDLNDTDFNNIPATPKSPKKDLVDFEIDYHLKPKSLKDAFAKHFKLTPNWEAKYNRQFLEWMVQVQATPEQVEHAANLWRSDKRFNWAVPTLKGIQEHWLELVEGSDQPQPDSEYVTL